MPNAGPQSAAVSARNALEIGRNSIAIVPNSIAKRKGQSLCVRVSVFECVLCQYWITRTRFLRIVELVCSKQRRRIKRTVRKTRVCPRENRAQTVNEHCVILQTSTHAKRSTLLSHTVRVTHIRTPNVLRNIYCAANSVRKYRLTEMRVRTITVPACFVGEKEKSILALCVCVCAVQAH